MSAGIWRAAAVIAAVLFLVTARLYDGARDELIDMRATAAANEKAARGTVASAAVTEGTAVKQIRAVHETARAKETVRKKTKEARDNETYRAWADAPAPDNAFRLLREAVPSGSDTRSATPGASGTVPGNDDPGTRH